MLPYSRFGVWSRERFFIQEETASESWLFVHIYLETLSYPSTYFSLLTICFFSKANKTRRHRHVEESAADDMVNDEDVDNCVACDNDVSIENTEPMS